MTLFNDILPFKKLKKAFFYVIEGRTIGNGKSLLTCILAYHYRLSEGKDIAANMDFKGLEYTKITSEEQLFELKDHIIFLDEQDINSWYDSREDGKVYYQKLMKNCRKNGNVIFYIVQDVSSLPKKMRNLFKRICYPYITNRLPEERLIKFMGNVYETDVSPYSVLEYQWYKYNDSICRPFTNLIRLQPVGKMVKINHLYWFFDKYDTEERIEKLEPMSMEKKSRYLKETKEDKEEKEKEE